MRGTRADVLRSLITLLQPHPLDAVCVRHKLKRSLPPKALCNIYQQH